MRRRCGPRRVVLAAGIALAAVLAGTPVQAVEPAGSANFTPPRSVPDYFSNESGPFRGTAAAAPSTQRDTGPIVAAPRPAAVAAAHRHVARQRVRIARAAARRRIVRRKIVAHRHIAHARLRRAPHVLAARHHAKPLARRAVAAKHPAVRGKGRQIARANS